MNRNSSGVTDIVRVGVESCILLLAGEGAANSDIWISDMALSYDIPAYMHLVPIHCSSMNLRRKLSKTNHCGKAMTAQCSQSS